MRVLDHGVLGRRRDRIEPPVTGSAGPVRAAVGAPQRVVEQRTRRLVPDQHPPQTRLDARLGGQRLPVARHPGQAGGARLDDRLHPTDHRARDKQPPAVEEALRMAQRVDRDQQPGRLQPHPGQTQPRHARRAEARGRWEAGGPPPGGGMALLVRRALAGRLGRRAPARGSCGRGGTNRLRKSLPALSSRHPRNATCWSRARWRVVAGSGSPRSLRIWTALGLGPGQAETFKLSCQLLLAGHDRALVRRADGKLLRGGVDKGCSARRRAAAVASASPCCQAVGWGPFGDGAWAGGQVAGGACGPARAEFLSTDVWRGGVLAGCGR
jgi:hypothetical protein